MPVGLGQVVNQRLDAVKRIGASATGFADNLVALLDALAFSTRNPFGTAALRTAGSAPGNVPFLDADGRLAAQVMPRAEVIDAIAARALASDLIALRDVVDDKAPLAAPVFTGSPARTGRIPTTDVSENLATTRFVAALIAAASTGSVTLPAITIGTEGTRTGNAPASAGDVFVQYGGTNPGLYVAQAEVIAAWVAGTAYAVGARVIQGGAYYRCTTANSDTTFTAAHWDVIAKPYVWSHVATTPRALQTVATLSATAAVGEAVLKTGAGTGLYIALAANEWTRMQERPTPVATLPSNPAAGDIAIKSGAGQGLYICVVAGTWIGVQGVDTGTAQPATGDLGSVFALQGAPAGQGRGGSVLARLTATDWYRLAVYGKDTARIGYNAPADIAGSADGDLYIRIGSVSPGLYQRVSGSWVAIAGDRDGDAAPGDGAGRGAVRAHGRRHRALRARERGVAAGRDPLGVEPPRGRGERRRVPSDHDGLGGALGAGRGQVGPDRAREHLQPHDERRRLVGLDRGAGILSECGHDRFRVADPGIHRGERGQPPGHGGAAKVHILDAGRGSRCVVDPGDVLARAFLGGRGDGIAAPANPVLLTLDRRADPLHEAWGRFGRLRQDAGDLGRPLLMPPWPVYRRAGAVAAECRPRR